MNNNISQQAPDPAEMPRSNDAPEPAVLQQADGSASPTDKSPSKDAPQAQEADQEPQARYWRIRTALEFVKLPLQAAIYAAGEIARTLLR